MKKVNEIYTLGRRVGLNKKDIDHVLNGVNSKAEQPSLKLGFGPYWAGGGYYGTISLKDFE